MLSENSRFACVITEQVDPKPLEENIKQLLLQGEKVIDAFKSPLYYVVFTNKRVVMREQNPDRSKIITHTVPYRSIDSFSVIYDKVIDFTHIIELRSNTLVAILNFKIEVDVNMISKFISEAIL